MLKLIQDKFRYKINECIISLSEKVAALISSLILTFLFIDGSVPNQSIEQSCVCVLWVHISIVLSLFL